jgi:hypothetical protein
MAVKHSRDAPRKTVCKDKRVPGVWMIDQKRWVVTRSETSFDPTNLQGVLGHVFQGTDGKWSIEGDPNGRRYVIAREAVQELIRLRSTDAT